MINPKPVEQSRATYRVGSLQPNTQLHGLKKQPGASFGALKNLKPLWVFIALAIVVGFSYLGYQYFAVKRITANSFANGQGFSLNALVNAQGTQLQGQSNGRTNIMVYGLTKDGLRTDTMLLVSYYWSEHKVVTLNIPRDLYTSYKGYNGKIVSLYAVAKAQNPDDKSYPPQYVSDFISKEYNIPINYWVVADFSGLKQVVDALGGVDVHNSTAFTDYLFPTDNYNGYMKPAPHFNAGTLHLDGNRALIYSRSRHSQTAGEGTDFARSARQMEVIKAILSQLKTEGILTDVTKINNFLQIFGQNVYTDFTPTELVSFAHTAQQLDFSTDYLKTNWSEASGFICDGVTLDGQDVLYYGVPGTCSAKTGINSPSPSRSLALEFIQNLLQNGKP